MKKQKYEIFEKQQIFNLAKDKLVKYGCNNRNASAVANTITDAELNGCPAHGLFRLPGFVASLKSGKANGKSNPKINQIAPVVYRIEGESGFSSLALNVSFNPLIRCAKKNGMAAAAIVDILHFSALWHEVEHLAQKGLVGFACTVSKPVVAPSGAKSPCFGTNPMAFSWPRKNKMPGFFDQASAAMARGEIMIAAREGHKLPQGVGIDRFGKSSNDPGKILDGCQLPFGGYKGSSIAMMIELLSSGLIGEDFSYERGKNDNNDGGPTRGGELLIAINPNLFGNKNNWQNHSESFFNELLKLKGTRLPGDRRIKNKEILEIKGVKVSKEIIEKIEEL